MWLGLIIFGVAITLYIFSRLGSFFKPGRNNAEKLYASKIYDASFFDGASEDYTEAMSRIRQYGGA